jgi:hypothetical protein
MEWGIVAFFDALGFKGLWSRHSEAQVLQAIEELAAILSKAASEISRDGVEMWRDLDIDVRPYSDFVAVMISPIPSFPPIGEANDDSYEGFLDAGKRYMLLRLMVLLVTKIISQGAELSPPLIYRGCISAGDFASNSIAFVGPAVDEAGAYHELAQGAFVFLTPSAVSAFARRPGFLLQRARFPYFMQYDVPLKGRGVLNTYAANPLIHQSKANVGSYLARIDASFGVPKEGSELREKQTNTRRFFARCAEDAGWAGFR